MKLEDELTIRFTRLAAPSVVKQSFHTKAGHNQHRLGSIFHNLIVSWVFCKATYNSYSKQCQIRITSWMLWFSGTALSLLRLRQSVMDGFSSAKNTMNSVTAKQQCSKTNAEAAVVLSQGTEQLYLHVVITSSFGIRSDRFRCMALLLILC